MKIEFEGPSQDTCTFLGMFVIILLGFFIAVEYTEHYKIIDLKKAQLSCENSKDLKAKR